MKPGGKSVLSTYPYLVPDTTHILKVGLLSYGGLLSELTRTSKLSLIVQMQMVETKLFFTVGWCSCSTWHIWRTTWFIHWCSKSRSRAGH
jgi:hypothetical protein